MEWKHYSFKNANPAPILAHPPSAQQDGLHPAILPELASLLLKHVLHEVGDRYCVDSVLVRCVRFIS